MKGSLLGLPHRPRRFGARIALLILIVLAAFSVSLTTTQRAFAADIPKVGDTAPDFELESLSGDKVKLSALLKSGPVVLVVLRGFPGYQCPFCTRQAGDLMSKAKQFAHVKAQVVMVYPGPADGLKQHAGDFVKGRTIPENFNLLLDPDFAFTTKYGLRWDSPHETSYPSTFVINSNGIIVFAKISHSHGDRSKSDDILKALQPAAEAR